MDILTPHEGITNEKICETQIEMLERKQNEYKLILIGQITAVPGHTLFKFNTYTRVASKAKMKTELHTQFNPKTGGLDVMKKSDVVVEKNCYYEQALNLKNFIKRLRRRGLIGENEQVKTE